MADDTDLGLKGWLSGRKAKKPTQPAASTVPSSDRRLAVLPLANISPDPRDEYFADGLTEELIARLSEVPTLKVIARTSVMNYKRKEKSIREIARELGVSSVIEGQRKEGRQQDKGDDSAHRPSHRRAPLV